MPASRGNEFPRYAYKVRHRRTPHPSSCRPLRLHFVPLRAGASTAFREKRGPEFILSLSKGSGGSHLWFMTPLSLVSFHSAATKKMYASCVEVIL